MKTSNNFQTNKKMYNVKTTHYIYCIKSKDSLEYNFVRPVEQLQVFSLMETIKISVASFSNQRMYFELFQPYFLYIIKALCT
ncbi:unconventional myosin-Va isoform X1 [Vespula maculifrons]|uniref:Unconventional myosin-Va isoform X1 n=1 Tax=Vespula maculifrons TaxID=7453 RepID=A0ABD2BHK5_VESMC